MINIAYGGSNSDKTILDLSEKYIPVPQNTNAVSYMSYTCSYGAFHMTYNIGATYINTVSKIW